MKSIGGAWVPALFLIGAIVSVAILFKKFVSKEGIFITKNSVSSLIFKFQMPIRSIEIKKNIPTINNFCLFLSFCQNKKSPNNVFILRSSYCWEHIRWNRHRCCYQPRKRTCLQRCRRVCQLRSSRLGRVRWSATCICLSVVFPNEVGFLRRPWSAIAGG